MKIDEFYFLADETRLSPEAALPMIVPVLNYKTLAERVMAFEQEQGWTHGDTYSGLAPRVHCYGSSQEHFLGMSRSIAWNGGKTPLLICSCGVPTCWPLLARVEADETWVTWSEFEQPHRPQWDYTGFGPFRFDREDYERVLVLISLEFEGGVD